MFAKSKKSAVTESDFGSDTSQSSVSSPVCEGDARALLKHLNQAYAESYPQEQFPLQDDVRTTEQSAEDFARSRSPNRLKPVRRRLFKIALACGVVALLVWQPMQGLLTASSVQAVVNARIVTLRAPIDGEVVLESVVNPGTQLQAGRRVLRIVNTRADNSRVADLRQRVDGLNEELGLLQGKLDVVLGEIGSAESELEQFRRARIKQLQARKSEILAEVTSAIVGRKFTAAALERAKDLASKGSASKVQLELSQRDDALAHQAVATAEKRLDFVSVELDALLSGHFVGDDYNDNPRTQQRLQELRQHAALLRAELAHNAARRTRLARELEDAQLKFAQKSEAELAVPSSSSVWEVHTASGEHVQEGQELIRLLDCSAPTVTANVTESIYNRLFVGAPAQLRLKDSAHDLDGRVVQMSGYAETPSNFAIAPSSLEKEPYRVTVAVDGLPEDENCLIGRTGRVTFDVPTAMAPSRIFMFANPRILDLGVPRGPN